MRNCSVLMGVYNGDNAEYFGKAIESILQQTLQSDDIVLCVDGPIRKELLVVVEHYIKEYPQVHPIWLPENVGQGRAFQRALPECRNEIVFRMDADDISVPERFEKQMHFLIDHPEVKLLSATISEFVDSVDNIVTVKRVPRTNEEIVRYARRWNPINQPSVVFYKSAVLSVGGYQDFYRHEDYYLWVRMLMAGFKAANLEESLLYYRLSSQNLKRRSDWNATKAAVRFHLWKHQVGFSGWLDTLFMIAVMVGIFVMPDFIFEKIYKRARR